MLESVFSERVSISNLFLLTNLCMVTNLWKHYFEFFSQTWIFWCCRVFWLFCSTSPRFLHWNLSFSKSFFSWKLFVATGFLCTHCHSGISVLFILWLSSHLPLSQIILHIIIEFPTIFYVTISHFPDHLNYEFFCYEPIMSVQKWVRNKMCSWLHSEGNSYYENHDASAWTL